MANEKRLTWKRSLDGHEDVGLREGVTVGEAICKLADLEERETVEVVHGRWIPVTERLPEDGVQVLAITKRGNPFPAHCAYGGEWRVSGSVKITHWMPLPDPPKDHHKHFPTGDCK